MGPAPGKPGPRASLTGVFGIAYLVTEIASKGASFAKLSPAEQDAVVTDLSQNKVPQAPQGFFNTVQTHTIQGTFSDPFYGGNADYVGWDLIGYPGVRIAVPAEYQHWNTELKPNHQSAYDSDMFSKGTI